MSDVFAIGVSATGNHGLADFLHRLPEGRKSYHVFRRDLNRADVGLCSFRGISSFEQIVFCHNSIYQMFIESQASFGIVVLFN